MANGDAPPPDVPHFDTRFMVQTPDGSTATQVLRTDRPISTDELTAHLAQQGSTFVGYPDAPASAAPPPAPTTAPLTLTTSDAPPLPSDVGAPSPAPAPAAASGDTWTQRASDLMLPKRSLGSQAPSIAGATVLGSVGGAVGALTGPAAPFAIPALSAAGAAAGGALGEGADIAYEKLTGAAPAEPGSAWARMGNAALRSGATELVAGPVAYVLRPITRALMPIGKAAAELAPVLAQDLPAGVRVVETTTPGVTRTIDSLLNPGNTAWLAKTSLTPEGQQTLFRAWWQRQAGQAPEKIAAAWDALPGSAQSTLAGGQRDAMQSLASTLKTGQDIPLVSSILGGGGGGVTGLAGHFTGHPVLGAVGTGLAVTRAAGEAVPYAASRIVQTPGGASFLAGIPRAASVLAPRLTLPAVGEVPVPFARAGVQTFVAAPGAWPATSTLWDGS